MRIVAGLYKGRRYEARIPSGVRPTADSVRETIFNILNNYVDFGGARVIDICAGTGFMGFEALSRGAAHCDFVEKSRKTAGFIKEATAYLKFPEDMFDIHNFDALAYLSRLDKEEVQYDIAFLDPPYIENEKHNLSNNIISLLYKQELIVAGGIVVAETSGISRLDVPEAWERLAGRNLGDTKVEFLAVI